MVLITHASPDIELAPGKVLHVPMLAKATYSFEQMRADIEHALPPDSGPHDWHYVDLGDHHGLAAVPVDSNRAAAMQKG